MAQPRGLTSAVVARAAHAFRDQSDFRPGMGASIFASVSMAARLIGIAMRVPPPISNPVPHCASRSKSRVSESCRCLHYRKVPVASLQDKTGGRLMTPFTVVLGLFLKGERLFSRWVTESGVL